VCRVQSTPAGTRLGIFRHDFEFHWTIRCSH
jgi:hypothetical protein